MPGRVRRLTYNDLYAYIVEHRTYHIDDAMALWEAIIVALRRRGGRVFVGDRYRDWKTISERKSAEWWQCELLPGVLLAESHYIKATAMLGHSTDVGALFTDWMADVVR